MLNKLKLPVLVLGTALSLLGPSAAQARRYETEHHHHRFNVFIGDPFSCRAASPQC